MNRIKSYDLINILIDRGCKTAASGASTVGAHATEHNRKTPTGASGAWSVTDSYRIKTGLV